MTFDLEKARDVAEFMVDNNCYGGERFADTLAEVERLRADLRNCSAYVGIGPGEGDLPIPERVRRTVNRLNGSVHRYEQKILAKDVQIRSLKIEETNLTGQIEQLDAEIERLRGFETAARDLNNDLTRIAGERDELAARIKELEAEVARVTDFSTKRMLVSYILELEDALVEGRAELAFLMDRTDDRLVDQCGDVWQAYWDIARQQLQVEGKIGPDAKPRSWQITEERKAALKIAEDELKKYSDYDSARAKRAIRAMLKEADHDKP